ncbi:MAG: hypothetical protein ACUVXD_16095 [Thermodesulfobacteriota bacterium]
MKYIDEFRDPQLAGPLLEEIRREVATLGDVTLMEVCGTHTVSIFRHGIRGLLPSNVKLLSGPGCPVCVTPNHYLDKAIACGRLPGVILATFGDMMRVPGSSSTLEREKAMGQDVFRGSVEQGRGLGGRVYRLRVAGTFSMRFPFWGGATPSIRGSSCPSLPSK